MLELVKRSLLKLMVQVQVTVQSVETEAENSKIGEAAATTERENPKADDIFDALVTQIEALGFEAKRIGNSLYITRDEPFTVTTLTVFC